MRVSARIAGLLILTGVSLAARARDCQRDCLEALMRSYPAALQAHDPGSMTLAADAKFTENAIGIVEAFRVVDGRIRQIFAHMQPACRAGSGWPASESLMQRGPMASARRRAWAAMPYRPRDTIWM